MRSFPILAFAVLISIVLGIYALPHLNKNEFPDVKIMQGVVAVVYPGATAEEIEEQVAGKVEEYLFTFTDVDKNNTYSYSQNGMLYVFVTLVHSNDDPKITWSRIREGLAFYRLTNLPQGVVATAAAMRRRCCWPSRVPSVRRVNWRLSPSSCRPVCVLSLRWDVSARWAPRRRR